MSIKEWADWLFQRLTEKLGWSQPFLVATLTIDQDWLQDDPVDEHDTFHEAVTFYLLEYPSGVRYYDFYEFGKCAEVDWHENFLGPIINWTYGGPLPRGAERPRDHADVISFAVLKGNAAKT
jgi:hypothetical protein